MFSDTLDSGIVGLLKVHRLHKEMTTEFMWQ